MDHSSDIHFGTIHRVSDLSFIKVPFRLANYSNRISYGNFELNSKMALEFAIKDPLKESSFNPELREMYLSWYTPFGQFNFGNIIHSWGILSNNSPTDNLSPTNYYYIFSKGTERKISQLALAGDLYFNNHSFGFAYNPNHQGTTIPINDSELPLELPLPSKLIVNEINSPEYAFRYRYSGSLFDVELSYFDGYDKTMSLLGANTWWSSSWGQQSLETAYVDTVLGYRQSEIIGAGFSTFINDLSLKTEVAYFFTDDQVNDKSDIYREFPGSYRGVDSDLCSEYNGYVANPNSHPVMDSLTLVNSLELNPCIPELQDNYPVGTKAEYFQYILELEYPIFLDIQLSAQFIFHDLVEISTGLPGENEEDKIVSLQTEIDLLPEHNFIPGLGAPLTIFTLEDHPEWGSQGTVNLVKSRTVYLNFKKFFLDYTLETNVRTFIDIINKGTFLEIENIYDITDSWKVSQAVNFITGNSSAGSNYPFNPMEDFSHFRVEFIYSF